MKTSRIPMKELWRRSGACLLMCAMLFGMLPALGISEGVAASYADPYLSRMVGWGFMRGDQEGDLNPDAAITRAEFVTIMNRAFGYNRLGPTPFQDVTPEDWFAQDVAIAYNTGYIAGTSENTFSPQKYISREEVAVMLTRNLMLEESIGENVSFTDGREISTWSSGLVSTAASYQLIAGYPDGTFRPQSAVSRGDTAVMIANAIGTPVKDPGDYSLGQVYGNVTITSSHVTLRDTVIGGNLYVTAGVDLGNVLLENVKVLGKIVISGGGVSESGEDSVVLRNVNAAGLLVDNLKNQQVSLRVEGDGIIEETQVRTDAYLVDNTASDYGLRNIALDGPEKIHLKLAGNVKKVVNYTPQSQISVAKGRVESVTVDEAAVNSILHITSGAEVDQVNLDVATAVTGDGDIASLIVNAPGCTVSMLPDQIVVRPGITAVIDGETMDSAAAAESSADPRMLAGYPRITDLAPNSATAQFSTNKRGTVHWAITSVSDGSVSSDELIRPSSYGGKIVKRGTVSVSGSAQPGSTKISGLVTDGSYYLSSVLVDARGDQSPLKVISFTTPDNSVPNFASGYPYLSKITNIAAQVTVMPTKTCRLYYTVLPKGATAPTPQDFKANSVSGNLGYGTIDVTKNVSYTFDVNSVPLEELKSYDLYLWLTDIDGPQSSAVKKLSFTTVDKTPPIFNTDATVNNVKETAVGLYANLNETGTLFWVVVKEGELYPKPIAGQSGTVDLSSDNAKLQVSAGLNALKSGKVNMTQNKDVSFNISGLDRESSYDLYYVAQDKAGNFSDPVKKITIHTLDNTPPTVKVEFTKYNGTDVNAPLADTDIRLVFSETVQSVSNNLPLVDLYNNVTKATTPEEKMAAKEELGNALNNSIYLYSVPINSQPEQIDGMPTGEAAREPVLNYREAEVKIEDGKTVVILPSGRGVNLKSGAEYYFEIQANTISDTSEAKNVMGRTVLDRFRTVFAQVNFSSLNVPRINVKGKDGEPARVVPVNAVWRLDPLTTQKVEDFVDWDMIIWTDTNISFNFYFKYGKEEEWTPLNDGEVTITLPSTTQGYLGVSLTKDFLKKGETSPEFPQLNTLHEDESYEFAMEFVTINGEKDRNAWNGRVNVRVNAIAGSSNELRLMAAHITEQNWEETVVKGPVSDIGLPENFTMKIPFTDQSLPRFTSGYPRFTPGATDVTMELLLNRAGTVYYVVAPKGSILTEDNKGNNYQKDEHYQMLPYEGGPDVDANMPTFLAPQTMEILNPENNYNTNPGIKYGNVMCGSSVVEHIVEGLTPETDYIIYFVIQNTAQSYSPVLGYRFTTTDVGTPYITLNNQSPSVQFKTSEHSELYYVLVPYNDQPPFLKEKFYDNKYMDKAAMDLFDKTQLNKEMTVLEAMIITIPQGSGNEGPSVFDVYANEGTKERMGKLIRQNQSIDPLTPVAAAKIDIKKEQTQLVNFMKNMKEGSSYYCMAVARNKDGVLDGFKAITDVHIPDTQPPILTVNTTTTKTEGGKYSGTVTLSFSENLYWLDENKKVLKEVWTTQPMGDEEQKAIFLTDYFGGGVLTKLQLVGGAQKVPKSSFTFNYKNVRPGDVLEFFNTGYVSDSSMNGRTKIILKYVVEQGGITGEMLVGRFIVSSGSIKGDSPTR